MLTAYVDESGHEGKDLVVLAGFLGDKKQWKTCEEEWRVGLGKRKGLHMHGLWRSKPKLIEALLSRLGSVPHDAGLQAIYATVRVSDYLDLVGGTRAEKLWKGYIINLLGLIDVISKNIPTDETFKLVLEAQDTYEVQAHAAYRACNARTPNGRRKLVSLEFIPKDESLLTQPADYLAYALLQKHRDPESERFRMCGPILKNIRHGLARDHVEQKDLLREFVLGILDKHPGLLQMTLPKPRRRDI